MEYSVNTNLRNKKRNRNPQSKYETERFEEKRNSEMRKG